MGFRLSWLEDNVAEEGHRVYRDDTPMDPDNLPTPIVDLGPDVTGYDDGNVTPGESYYYRVGAYRVGAYTAGDTVEVVSDEIEALAVEPDFTPADLFTSGEEGQWFDISDLATLFQDTAGTVPVTADGDPVALILDKSGNDKHAIQSSSSLRPTYRTSGGLHWLESAGGSNGERIGVSNDLMVQPFSAAIAIKSNSLSANMQLIDSDNVTYPGESRSFVGIRDSNFKMYAGTFVDSGVSVDLLPHTIISVFNDANSSIQVDNSTKITSDSGERDWGGFWLFDSKVTEGSGDTFDGRFYQALKINRALSLGEQIDLKDYLNSKAGI